MSEPSYGDGEVVWVKWSTYWWPGEVWDKARVPEDIHSSLKKPVIAFVKFFQEESFEFVYSHNCIMKYDCPKKLDFIKKGMDKYKTSSKVMSNFPTDVVKAEELTKGNVNILKTLETPKKQKPSTPFATPDKTIAESSPAVSKKSTGAYNSTSKVQLTPSPAPKSDKMFTCTLCSYSTERINLLMLHIKNHSSTKTTRVIEPSPVVVKKTQAKSPAKRAVKEDTIADDVRKIKESLMETKPTPVKKARDLVKSTPTSSRSRASKKEEKLAAVVKEEVKKVEEKPKPVNELKNELLADWCDDDDDDEVVQEKIKVEATPPPKPSPIPEKVGETSRSIRNIPKKQRISEVYIKQEIVKVETTQAVEPLISKKVEEKLDEVALPEVSKKIQKSNKRKRSTIEVASEPEPIKEVKEETPIDDLLMATAELLNKTEVPKVENAQLQMPSTFHKSNDIDKRNLPPKERNKRIFRASKNNRESPTKANEILTVDNNGSTPKNEEPVAITSPIQNELMLPHKKKQSSRVLTPDKPSPTRENRSFRETRQEAPTTESRRKKRKSTEPSSIEMETNSHDPVATVMIDEVVQSPLRDAIVAISPQAVTSTSNSISSQRRGQKRRNSKDPHDLASSLEPESFSEPKKLHTSELSPEVLPKTLVVACATETICITSKGQLSVARKDTSVTTQANTVVVTSQVIITEATRPPIVSLAPSETVFSPKPQISSPVKIPHQSKKKAVKMPAEDLLEMKKQGLVTVGIDNKNKFTEKGRQIFKQITEKASEADKEEPEKIAPASEQTLNDSPELPLPAITNNAKVAEDIDVQESIEKVEAVEDKVASVEPAEDKQPELHLTNVKESNGSPVPEVVAVESTNNNDIEKELVVVVESPPKETQEELVIQEPFENGKEADNDQEVSTDDPNSGGAGLIALQAETFGGPPNCFYLCRQVEDRYEPVDNQILVLNAQNALVPYEGDNVTEDSLGPNESSAENLANYPQLSPNSNIIINTPSGQKIELNHYAILALQEQADENGMASIELSGEHLELNINGILEAISAQQEANEAGDSLIPSSAMLIDGDGALILETPDLPVEIHHSATQVSETLSKPIMSTTIAPEISSMKATISETVSKNLNIEDSLASIGVTTQQTRSNMPKSLELPITITNPAIAETVNHRKLANAAALGDITELSVEPESFVVQSVDNGSQG